MDAEHCDVLMDEVTGVASSRESQSLPAPVANLLVQLRRRDVVLRWTSPAWARADRIIRECTQAVAVCSGHFPRRDPGRLWPSNRVFRAKLMDARTMDDLTESKITGGGSLDVSWMRLHGCIATRAYDTLDQVLSLPVIEGGRCAVCGGRRRVPACTCEH